MPKLIRHLRETILEITKKTLLTQGYQALTMRGVAAECGIAAGTLYNYFENKDFLVANVMLEDWILALAQMRRDCLSAASPTDGFRAIYESILSFQKPYIKIWEQYSFSGQSRGVLHERHLQLVEQLHLVVHELLARFSIEESDYIELFLTENTLTVANEGRDFAPFAEIIHRILSF